MAVMSLLQRLQADEHAYECWAGRGGTCRTGCSCKCHVPQPRKPRWLDRAGKDFTGAMRLVG